MHGVVEDGPTCPPGKRRTDSYAASRFLGHDNSRVDMDIFEEPENKWKIETATSAAGNDASLSSNDAMMAGLAAVGVGVGMLL